MTDTLEPALPAILTYGPPQPVAAMCAGRRDVD
jgi:hypothetical protein